MKVLIAEDRKTSRIILEQWLPEWGYQTVSAGDGEAAWEAMQASGWPQLALVDWMMPKMDGIELCKKIKQSEELPFIYVILLTTKNTKEDIVTGLDAGADDFISKPVQPAELRSRLNVGNRIVEYQQKLLEMDEQKNKFLGMAAHDLRNPLSSILGFTEVLQKGNLEPQHQKEFLDIICQTSKEMLVTVNDLLDISVIESGKFDLRLGETNLSQLVANRVRLNAINAGQKQIRIDISVADDVCILCDAERIGQVLDNLISNAAKFSPSNTRIRVSMETKKDCIEISVQDEGAGIPAERQDRLFSTHGEVGVKPTGGEKSTGLGLAIVKKIIESHNGQVGVESRENAGSRFFFTLPLQMQIPPLRGKTKAVRKQRNMRKTRK